MSKGSNGNVIRKKPERRCVGCGETRLKTELVRVVRSPEGDVAVDLTGKRSGRGAYLCHDPACLRKAKKSRRLENALSCAIPDEVYVRLEADLVGNE